MTREAVCGTLTCVLALSAPVAVVLTHNVFVGAGLAFSALLASAYYDVRSHRV